MTKLATERTIAILSGAKLPLDQKNLKVPDTAGCFDQEQQLLTQAYKDVFNCTEASSTFKISEKEGERVVYEPSVINNLGTISVEWGDKIVPLVSTARYSPMSNTVYVIVGNGEEAVEYSLKVRVIVLKPEDAKTKVQKEYALLPRESRAEYLQKAWEKGTMVQLLSEGFPDVLKLGDLPAGKYEIVEYRMNRFDTYEVKLEDGRWLRTNTVMGQKLAGYQEMGIAVSVEEPALLSLGVSTSKTAQGHSIYPTTLVSFKNVNIPVFDFGSLMDNGKKDPLTPQDEAYDLSNIPF